LSEHADSRTTLVFNIPLAEVVTDYFDQLKSRSKGYASMEYKITGYRCAPHACCDCIVLRTSSCGVAAQLPPASGVAQLRYRQ
jgi:translation elongation factor EF-4